MNYKEDKRSTPGCIKILLSKAKKQRILKVAREVISPLKTDLQ